jgi:acetoacetyl-CoA reductase
MEMIGATENRYTLASLNGRVALITGAARGIGRAIALELARRGAAVALNYHSSRPESLAAEIAALGRRSMLVSGDVAEKDEAAHVVGQVVAAWGRIDILVNNAGIRHDKSSRKVPGDDWGDVIDINLNGTYYCTSAALPHMIRQQFGRIINIASPSHLAGCPGKGDILAYTKSVALEMARHNITANAIAPGFTSTETIESIPNEILDQIKSRIPLGRFARPDEIGRAAAFLAADADYMTGQQLSVNGGISMA